MYNQTTIMTSKFTLLVYPTDQFAMEEIRTQLLVYYYVGFYADHPTPMIDYYSQLHAFLEILTTVIGPNFFEVENFPTILRIWV